MFFSKIWILLLSIAVTAAFGLALLAPGPAGRDLTRAAVASLDGDQHNAEMMLRLEARDWIDTAAKMARDRTLVESLEQASDGAGSVDQHKAKLQGRLLSLVSMLKPETRPELVIAVDVKGKQVYRMGIGEDTYTPGKDGLIGYPLVEEALRGGRRDDTWSINGKLFLMAASPVVSRAKGRYVGALLLGEAVNDAFARRLKLQLGGTDVGIFLRGKVVGSSAETTGLEGLPARAKEPARAAEMKKKGRTGTFLVGAGSDAFYAVLTPLPGEAGAHEAFYAVLRKPPAVAGLSEVINKVGGPDLAWGTFPWLLLGGVFLLALLVGLLLSFWEVNMPLGRLVKEMERVVRGEARRLEYKGFSGKYRRLAATFNEAVASQVKATVATVSGALPVIPAAEDPSRAAPTPQAALAADPVLEPADPPAEAPAKKKGGFMPAGMEPEELATEIQQLPPSFAQSNGHDTVLDPPPSADLPGLGKRAPFEAAPSPAPAGEVVVQPAGSNGGGLSKASTVMSSIPEAMARADATGEVETDEEDDRYIMSVYEEFTDMKNQCGEDTSKLTFDRFASKLRRNRQNLIDRFGCKTVKFQVYVKDGKAALKATPIKE